MNKRKIPFYKYISACWQRVKPKIVCGDSSDFFNYVYTKRKDLDEALPEMEVLALRGSLSDYGFYSPSWSKSFNFGLTSSDLSVALETYKKVFRDAPNLKIVLLYSGVFVPGFNLAYTSECHRLVSYKHFFGIDYDSVNKIQKNTERRILRKIKKFSFECRKSNRGYIYEKPHFPGIDVSVRAKTHLRENQREPDQMGCFRRLRDLVELDGRLLYLIIPPVRSDYKNALKDVSNGDLFEKFKLMMPSDRVLDFYDNTKFTNDDFGDCDHLNEFGAQKLTAMIKSRILV